MWWTAIKIAAITSGALLTLLFIALVVMVTRPAILVGVSGDDLAYSLAGGSSPSDGGACRKTGSDDWVCGVGGPGAGGSYLVDVNWMGCWKATPTGSNPRKGSRPTGCIQLGDVFTLESLGN